ncbi:hypothetical protein C8R44DRAFT_873874 [Mycena epipterygia]|nr:hypothetical protein C8R44DRAFT_873874 [Mycena epipterygia]
MAGPYYPYGGNQGFYNNSEYNYYQLNSSNGYADGYYVRDYGVYGGYDVDYGQYSNPTNLPLPQPPAPPPRQRTPTPPPAEPSQEYLAASLSPQPSSVPHGQRKLLIFDLNGTLLLRSPRNYGQRKIYLRPYAHALVAYIAHPAVRAWLDCMVWSSAQAHNVREMVERVFGAGEGAGSGPILRAVWARDTLGLGREAFHQKTQTTKDLAKPWAFFAAPPAAKLSPARSSPSPSHNNEYPMHTFEGNQVYSPTANGGGDGSTCRHPSPEAVPSVFPARPSSPSQSETRPILHWPDLPAGWRDPSLSESAPKSTAVPTEVTPLAADPVPPPYPHGPQTTLLVDDSPLKARLQPWNHLCVGEYDAATRARDCAVVRLPPDTDPSPDAPKSHGTDAPRHEKSRNSLHAELAELAEEESAAAKDTGEHPINTTVRKERWRKRRREETGKLQDGQAEGSGIVEGFGSDAPEGASTSTVAPDDEAAVTVPSVSKRAQRKERRRLRQAENLANGSASQSLVDTPEKQQPTGVDEPASGSGSTDASGSSSPPSLPSAMADVEASSGSFKTEATGSGGIDTRINVDADAPPASSADGGSKKRKRQLEDSEDRNVDTAEAHTPSLNACPEPYDPTLLAVIGVLAHARTVGNVAAWVRSGGLAVVAQDGGVDSMVGAQEDASQAKEEATQDGAVDDAGVGVMSSDRTSPPSSAPKAEPDLASDPAKWFTSRRVLNAWAARGRAALAELGIDAVPGIE